MLKPFQQWQSVGNSRNCTESLRYWFTISGVSSLRSIEGRGGGNVGQRTHYLSLRFASVSRNGTLSEIDMESPQLHFVAQS